MDVEVLDLRTLAPLDYPTIFESVKKTGRALIVHEDNLTGGIGGEISARITEECFAYLDAPVMRCGSMDMPIPFSAEIEKVYLANHKLDSVLSKLIQY